MLGQNKTNTRPSTPPLVTGNVELEEFIREKLKVELTKGLQDQQGAFIKGVQESTQAYLEENSLAKEEQRRIIDLQVALKAWLISEMKAEEGLLLNHLVQLRIEGNPNTKTTVKSYQKILQAKFTGLTKVYTTNLENCKERQEFEKEAKEGLTQTLKEQREDFVVQIKGNAKSHLRDLKDHVSKEIRLEIKQYLEKHLKSLGKWFDSEMEKESRQYLGHLTKMKEKNSDPGTLQAEMVARKEELKEKAQNYSQEALARLEGYQKNLGLVVAFRDNLDKHGIGRVDKIAKQRREELEKELVERIRGGKMWRDEEREEEEGPQVEEKGAEEETIKPQTKKEKKRLEKERLEKERLEKERLEEEEDIRESYSAEFEEIESGIEKFLEKTREAIYKEIQAQQNQLLWEIGKKEEIDAIVQKMEKTTDPETRKSLWAELTKLNEDPDLQKPNLQKTVDSCKARILNILTSFKNLKLDSLLKDPEYHTLGVPNPELEVTEFDPTSGLSNKYNTFSSGALESLGQYSTPKPLTEDQAARLNSANLIESGVSFARSSVLLTQIIYSKVQQELFKQKIKNANEELSETEIPKEEIEKKNKRVRVGFDENPREREHKALSGYNESILDDVQIKRGIANLSTGSKGILKDKESEPSKKPKPSPENPQAERLDVARVRKRTPATTSCR